MRTSRSSCLERSPGARGPGSPPARRYRMANVYCQILMEGRHGLPKWFVAPKKYMSPLKQNLHCQGSYQTLQTSKSRGLHSSILIYLSRLEHCTALRAVCSSFPPTAWHSFALSALGFLKLESCTRSSSLILGMKCCTCSFKKSIYIYICAQ